ncbi:class I SAM-dependent DNA methyltransferase [Leptospira sarikeiensis]|uniref:Class I SAM-dependent methyltransferase n=1 Tax=Leptospira sarikeiensis TaxID=2484943 RepID=A0A4R9K0E1_9LEPT|nr:class I SAM-dependent methyltransferase [Leptospira sarikeiensis]TGL58476.1 class I SAM-dependent methyltransferase [Leptospira sarikeiensis]
MDRNTRDQENKSRIISPIPKKRPYTAFAGIYDKVMKQAPYLDWAEMILEAYRIGTEKNIPKRALDLGCGTCKIWKFLPDKTDLLGIDNSSEMLQIADSQQIRGTRHLAELTSFPPFPAKFDLVFSVHDTLNYFLNEEELFRIFSQVSEVLESPGVFFFDVSTLENFKKNFQNKTIKENHGKTKLLWRNEFDPKNAILKTSLEFNGPDFSGVEEHFHKAYPLETWKRLLENSKMEILGIGSDYDSWEVRPKANYWNFICRKK